MEHHQVHYSHDGLQRHSAMFDNFSKWLRIHRYEYKSTWHCIIEYIYIPIEMSWHLNATKCPYIYIVMHNTLYHAVSRYKILLCSRVFGPPCGRCWSKSLALSPQGAASPHLHGHRRPHRAVGWSLGAHRTSSPTRIWREKSGSASLKVLVLTQKSHVVHYVHCVFSRSFHAFQRATSLYWIDSMPQAQRNT